ncbi:hypothetical protein [Nocardia neocaledoniensis]|uniref:hypothetical protein n=1 Tax=Nocardia neocaledoniensis TaxID=236511 RepID=UPI002456CF1F|nr:hypothetical protein [Nocardia neocaledoniensis]
MAACGWVVDWSTTPCNSATAQDKAVAEQLAAATLWALSGRVFGVCPETVRPDPAPAARPSTYYGGERHAGWWPQQMTPGWAAGGCGCSTACDCSADRLRVALPGPVQSVTAVWVDGQQLAAAAYRVQDRRWLLRVDGKVWPRHQDLTLPDHAEGAFTVTYERGIPIPAAGKMALGELACEFVKARNGNGKCSIPSRAQQVARQGVTIELIDPATLFESGLTGVEIVDRWLASVNPGRRRAPSRVYSPDAPRAARMR